MLWLGLSAFPESVLSPQRNELEILHATGSLSASALGLRSPVILAHLLVGESTRSTTLVLDVVAGLSASLAKRMRLRMAFTKRGGTFSLLSTR